MAITHERWRPHCAILRPSLAVVNQGMQQLHGRGPFGHATTTTTTTTSPPILFALPTMSKLYPSSLLVPLLLFVLYLAIASVSCSLLVSKVKENKKKKTLYPNGYSPVGERHKGSSKVWQIVRRKQNRYPGCGGGSGSAISVRSSQAPSPLPPTPLKQKGHRPAKLCALPAPT